jgi:hypothetical protein
MVPGTIQYSDLFDRLAYFSSYFPPPIPEREVYASGDVHLFARPGARSRRQASASSTTITSYSEARGPACSVDRR